MIHANAESMQCHPSRGVHARCHFVGRLVVLLLGLLLLAVAGRAQADCSYTNQPGTVTFAPPATITLPNSLPVGTILWTSSPIPPTNYPTLTCNGTTNSGVVNNMGGQPGSGDDTLFPTNVSGLSYRLLHPDTPSPLHAYPNQSVSTGNVQFNVATALQLVVTGPIAPGSVMTGGKLAQWNVDMGFCFGPYCFPIGTYPVEVFNTSSITFVAPACTVVNKNLTVMLPTVYASAFPGTGSATGQTPFNVQLSCSAGSNVSITLSTANQQSGTTSVIAPTAGAGYAGNVGVQLYKDSSCTAPVSFGTAIPEGATPNGAMNLPFCASYYQTDTPVAAGRVTATATYTLTYQ